MTRKNNSNYEAIIATVLATVTDLIPVFLDKWSMMNESPRIGDLEDDLERQKFRLLALESRHQVYLVIFFFLILWNGFLTYLVLR